MEAQKLNCINQQTTKLLLNAKKQYKNLHTSTIAFLPKLSKVDL